MLNFFKKSGLASEDILIQRAYFSRSINPELLYAIKEGTTPDTPIYGEGGLLEKLENEFEVLYPLFIECMKLMQLEQNGENTRVYLQCINCLSMAAKFNSDPEAVETDKHKS